MRADCGFVFVTAVETFDQPGRDDAGGDGDEAYAKDGNTSGKDAAAKCDRLNAVDANCRERGDSPPKRGEGVFENIGLGIVFRGIDEKRGNNHQEKDKEERRHDVTRLVLDHFTDCGKRLEMAVELEDTKKPHEAQCPQTEESRRKKERSIKRQNGNQVNNRHCRKDILHPRLPRGHLRIKTGRSPNAQKIFNREDNRNRPFRQQQPGMYPRRNIKCHHKDDDDTRQNQQRNEEVEYPSEDIRVIGRTDYVEYSLFKAHSASLDAFCGLAGGCSCASASFSNCSVRDGFSFETAAGGCSSFFSTGFFSHFFDA